MGLQDILEGMMNGPRGQRQPTSAGAGGSGGMSPITMALLGLLAYKALKNFGGAQAASPTGSSHPTSLPPDGSVQAGYPGGGGLSDLLGGLLGGRPGGAKPGANASDAISGGLGGLLGGAAAGGVLSGGLDRLIKDFQNSGQGRAAQSWVGTGPNQEITPAGLETALGQDTLDALARQTGMGRDDLLAGLRQNLPALIDQLTPNGRLPTEEEASRMI